jgi:aspartate ammonia-lyase
MRIEKDLLGSKEIDDQALYGIHALRARENFPGNSQFNKKWYKAMGLVKHACYLTYEKYASAIAKKYGENPPVNLFENEKIKLLQNASLKIANGEHFEHFIVPAIQGGAGTSINMNINEIGTNLALIEYGKKPGEYDFIDPIEHANIFQSTNDTVPTSLTVATMRLLEELETAVNHSRNEVEKLESKYRNTLRVGYTQLQQAVPTSYGKMFSTYSDALSRDWWRVSKCAERIKVVNLGGSAIGSGITVPTYFIMEAVPTLQKLTGLPITRGENMMDTTSNMDSFVEIHATLKAHAVNLEKMANDIRILAADISNHSEFKIPERQAGSSIMPGKINPVIPEFIISSAHKVYANDQLISSLSGQGNLELNAYIPQIGDALLDTLEVLINANQSMAEYLIKGITIDTHKANDKLYNSPSICTALIPYIGYHKSGEIAKYMQENQVSIFEANEKLKLIENTKLKQITEPSNLLKLGYKPSDL